MKTKSPGAQRHACRHGKIARLPHAVREELNQRLLDGESGRNLVFWLNAQRQVKAALKREFGGGAINEQNLSDWKHGGFRDWVAKKEAEQLMDDTLAESRDLKKNGGARARGSRRKSGEKDAETECLSDKVAGWFFPYYVAAARGQLSAAETPGDRWSVLRTICSDLASLRRSDHYVERLRIWQEKLRVETGLATDEGEEVKKEEFLEWARKQPDIEQMLWPDRKRLSPADRRKAVRKILGISDPVRRARPMKKASAPMSESREVVRDGDPEDAESGVKNQGGSR